MKYLYIGIFSFVVSACGGTPPIKVQSYSKSNMGPVADSSGWYSFGGMKYKGPIVNGMPDGDGLCTGSYGYGESPCTFRNGNRVDKEYLAERKDEIKEKMDKELKERQRREEYEARRSAEHNRTVREIDRGMSESIRQVGAQNAAIIARIDSQTNDAYAQTNRVLASQAAERKRAREDADERAAQRRRDVERERTARIASADAQRERDRQAEKVRVREEEQRRQREAQAAAERQAREQEQARLLAAKNEAPKNKIIVGEGDSELCFSRATSEKQAEVNASNNASDECRALGNKWHFKGVKFGGYMGCTPCGGGEKGNFRCKVTKATYSCEYW